MWRDHAGSWDKITTWKIRKEWESVTSAGCWGKQGSSSWSISSAWLSPVAAIHGWTTPGFVSPLPPAATWTLWELLGVPCAAPGAGIALTRGLGLLSQEGFGCSSAPNPSSVPVPRAGFDASLCELLTSLPTTPNQHFPLHIWWFPNNSVGSFFFSPQDFMKKGFRIPFFLLQLKIRHMSVNDVVCQISQKCPECCD